MTVLQISYLSVFAHASNLRVMNTGYLILEIERQDIFKSTLASFNHVYAYITQVCRLLDKEIHKFSVYSKFLYTMLPKGQGEEKVNIDDKIKGVYMAETVADIIAVTFTSILFFVQFRKAMEEIPDISDL